MYKIVFLFCVFLALLLPIDLFAQSAKYTLPRWHTLLNSNCTTEEDYQRALSEAMKSGQIDRYPEEQVLSSRAFFRLNNGKLFEAEQDCKSALVIAEDSLNHIWTETLSVSDPRYVGSRFFSLITLIAYV